MKGLLIIVNYKSDEYSIEFIKRHIEINNEQVKLIVVDNSNSKVLRNYIKDLDTDIQYYSPNNNLGYFGAAKWILDKIEYQTQDFVIISNNDVQILNKDFFRILENLLQKADVIAPSITNSFGKQQNPHRFIRLSKLHVLFWELYFTNYHIAKILLLLKLLIHNKNKKNTLVLTETEIFSPHGAFIILASTFFKKGGYIDNGFFLYGEEDSIGYQCHERKMKVIFSPELKILHNESSSIGKKLSKTKYQFQKEAFKYIKGKYY